jgi:diguanylate cyclase (GGDEF)-like protein
MEFFGGHELGRFLFATMLLLIALVIARQILTLVVTARENVDLARRLGTRERQIQHQAHHDALTDLVNRARFSDLVVEALSRRVVQGGPPAAVLFIDVDDLTMVNDTIGPQAGDRLLVAVAQRLRACVRPTDTVGRIGGDEFAVLIPEVRGSEQLVDVAERILDALGEPAGVGDGVGVRPTVSLGVAVADHPELGADEVLRRADVAMHAAMAGGKGLVGIFEPTLQVVLERPRAARNAGGYRTAAGGEPRSEDGARLWLARELHDGALQTLTTMLLDMEQVRRELPETAVSHRVRDFQGSIRSVIGGLRRLLGELRDQSGDDHRLVEDLAVLLGQLDGRAGIKGQLSVSPSWPSSLSTHIASHLRRIAEEALRNVALHSGAQRVMVSLEAEEERLMLTVSDDGRGCPAEEGAVSRGGCGLLGMQERALILGGHLEVSSRPGAGTMVRGTFSSRSA